MNFENMYFQKISLTSEKSIKMKISNEKIGGQIQKKLKK